MAKTHTFSVPYGKYFTYGSIDRSPEDDSYNDGLIQIRHAVGADETYTEAYIEVNLTTPPYNCTIKKVTVRLCVKDGSSGKFSFNGTTYEAAETKIIESDVTHLITNVAYKNMTYLWGVDKEKFVSVDFETEGENKPILIIEADFPDGSELPLEYGTAKYYKPFELPDGITLNADFLYDKRACIFKDFQANGHYLNFALSHIYVNDSYWGDYGFGVRLNITETYNHKGRFITDCYGDTHDKALSTSIPIAVNNYPEVEDLGFCDGVTNSMLRVKYWYDNGSLVKGYNYDGKLVFMSDYNGNCISIKYIPITFKLENISFSNRKNGEGSKILYEFKYVNSDKVTKVVDNLHNKSIEYTYSDGYLKTITKDGNVTELIPNGQALKIKTPSGYVCDISGTGVAVRSNLSRIPGGITAEQPDIASYTVTTQGNTVRIKDIDGNVEQLEVDKNSLCARYLETRGVVTFAERYKYIKGEKYNVYKCKYDKLGSESLDSFEFETGNMQEKTLNLYDQPKSIVAKNELTQTVTVYTYDNNNRVTQERTIVIYLNNDETFTYCTEYDYGTDDESTSVTKVHYVEGEEDTRGKTKEITKHFYSGANKGKVEITISNNLTGDKFVTEYFTNDMGQVIKENGVFPDSETEYEYEGDNLKSVTYPNGLKISYTYNADGTLKSVSGNSKTNNIVTTKGEITSLYNSSDNIGFSYDKKRRLSEVTIDGVFREGYAYTIITNITGNNSDYFVHAMGDNVEIGDKINSDGTKLERYYKNDFMDETLVYSVTSDKMGKIISETHALTGLTANYGYDGLGRQTIYSTNNLTEYYTYNDYGELSKVEYSGIVTDVTNYSYKGNSSRQLESVSHSNGAKVAYDYDYFGRMVKKSYSNSGNMVFTQGIEYYNGTNGNTSVYPSKITYSDKGLPIKYYYNNMGNIYRQEIFSQDLYYTYDNLNRLVTETNNATKEDYRYTYDDYGNITKKQVTPHDTDYTVINNYTYSGNKLISVNGASCEYDDYGNPTTYRSKPAVWAGSLLKSYNGTNFSYDGKGRLVKIGNNTVYYDCESRIMKYGAMQFFYDESSVMGFVYNGNKYFYKKDAQGNVFEILNSSGALVTRYYYNAWGEHKIVGDTVIGNLNPFRYRSYFYETNTKFYYLQTRFYDPDTCRFINADSVKFATPMHLNGLNLYAYCNNNPVMYSDPTGTFVWSVLLSIALQTVVSTASYIGMAVASIWDEDIREDLNNINWNPFNSNEGSVLASKKVSFYKGAPVFRFNSKKGRSGTFLAIFLARGVSNVDTVKHEWGHIAQQMMMGPGTYGITVGIPSPLKLGSWGGYYNAPWETMADILGGASRKHSKEEINRAWAYYSISVQFSPAAFLFLF